MLSGSVANILLQITGDSSQAREELDAVARDLAIFGRETAEAEADINTEGAKANLEELKAKLAEFSAEDATAEVNVRIAQAQADIAVLQAELDRIDGENVTVDVDVRRGIVEKLASLTRQIDTLGEDAEEASSGGLRGLIGSFASAFSEAEIFGVSLTRIIAIGPFVVAAVVAILGQVAALVASFGAAALGAGALAIALGATLGPAIGLAVGAIANFKEDFETAGTAAYALKGNAEELFDVFKKATASGSDALFKGISDAIREFAPVVQELGPAFTKLGKAGGDAFRTLANQFSSPAWRSFFSFVTEALAELTPLFAQSFGAAAGILRNIARAAMPFVISGFEKLAEVLQALQGKTSNIKGLREDIGGLVESLKSVGHLLGGLGNLAAAFVEAFAPFGNEIADSLGEGANHLAEWLRSSEGLRKIEQFFERTGPLASELGNLLLNVALALTQLGILVAPALTPIVHVFNDLFEAINAGLSWLNDHAPFILKGFFAALAPISVLLPVFKSIGEVGLEVGEAIASGIQAAIGAVSDAASAISSALDAVESALGDAADWIGGIPGTIENAFSAAISFVVGLIEDLVSHIGDLPGLIGKALIVSAVAPFIALGLVIEATEVAFRALKMLFSAGLKLAISVVGDVLGEVKTLWNGARQIASEVINFVLGAPSAVLGVIRDIWKVAKSVVSGVIDFVLKAPRDVLGAVRDIWKVAKGTVSKVIDFVLKAPRDVLGVIRSIWQSAKVIVSAAINFVLKVPRDAVGVARDVWSAVKGVISDAIQFVLTLPGTGGLVNAAKSIWNAINDALPDISINIHIPTPSLPDIPGFASGVTNFVGGLARVGEQGEEIVYLPPGADVVPALPTRAILSGLARHASAPASPSGALAPVFAGSSSGDTFVENHFHTPATGNPDPEVVAAQMALGMRRKGRRR